MANESGLNFISVKGPELLNMVCAGHCAFVRSNGSCVVYPLLKMFSSDVFLVKRKQLSG